MLPFCGRRPGDIHIYLCLLMCMRVFFIIKLATHAFDRPLCRLLFAVTSHGLQTRATVMEIQYF